MSGDQFKLDLHLISGGSPAADIFVLLDVYGAYWFWPSWSEIADYETMTVSPGVTSMNLFDFTWPVVEGSAGNLFFWAGAVSSGTADLLGDFDWVEFGYQ